MQIITTPDGEIRFILADNTSIHADENGKLQFTTADDHVTTVNDLQHADVNIVTGLDDNLFVHSIASYEYLPYIDGQIALTDAAKQKYGV